MHRRRQGRVHTPGLSARVQRNGDVLSQIPVEDLSMGGARVRSPRVFPVGARVELGIFPIGAVVPISIPARVASVTRADPRRGGLTAMGLAFLGYGPAIASRLRDVLMSYAEAPSVLEGDAASSPCEPKPGSEVATARLAVQLKWLLLEVADWKAQAAMLEARNQALQQQLDALFDLMSPPSE